MVGLGFDFDDGNGSFFSFYFLSPLASLLGLVALLCRYHFVVGPKSQFV